MKKEFLDLLVKKGALRISKGADDLFVFKSGRKSPNMVNMGALTDGESLSALKEAYADAIFSLVREKKISDFDFIFGPAYKGIPLATLAVQGLYEKYGLEKRTLYDRKEEKAYGDKASDKVIVGAGHYREGGRILIVDDVITTGGAKLDALEKLKLLKDHRVVGIVIAVDRQEKMGDAEKVEGLSASKSMEEKYGIKCFSILNMEDIYSSVKESLDPQIKDLWVDYYKKYGDVKLG